MGMFSWLKFGKKKTAEAPAMESKPASAPAAPPAAPAKKPAAAKPSGSKAPAKKK